jgi:hypothetical protein
MVAVSPRRARFFFGDLLVGGEGVRASCCPVAAPWARDRSGRLVGEGGELRRLSNRQCVAAIDR